MMSKFTLEGSDWKVPAAMELDDITKLISENKRLRAALENCIGFCKRCGGTYPHRLGEGRLLDCCGIVEELSPTQDT